MAQNTIQNSSVLYPEDMILYVSTMSTLATASSELSTGFTWQNAGSLSEFSLESANASAQPASLNVEHDQIITKEAETINVVLQEINQTIMNILRGETGQVQSTLLDIVGGTSSAALEILYTGGADRLEPYALWVYQKYADGRSKSVYYPFCHYVSGGAGANPKAQGSGEFQDVPFTIEARESTSFVYNTRNIFRIEMESTAST